MQCQLNPVLVKVSELSSALQFLREKCETHRKSEVRLSPQGTVGAAEAYVRGKPKSLLGFSFPTAVPGLDRDASTGLFQCSFPIFIFQ